MAAHTVPHGVGAVLHLPDLLQRKAQLPKQLDPPQDLHLSLPIVPVTVLAVPPGGEQSLRLIKADVLPRDAHQGFHFIDFQGITPHLWGQGTPSTRGKVKRLSKFLYRGWEVGAGCGTITAMRRLCGWTG